MWGSLWGARSGAQALLRWRMDRGEFEVVRDIPDKIIQGDIRLSARRQTQPVLVAENVQIENSVGMVLKLNVSFNPETGSKTFNVTAAGVGPICRLDVDGPAHRPAGRSHKHSLQTERCPDRNLPDGVTDRADLAGKSVVELFAIFCQMANITHQGNFIPPP
jgi:hypothetical protein